MDLADIARLRLRNQRLSHPDLPSPAEAVRWFGAVQSQDLPGSLHAIGLRVPGSTETSVEQAIADKSLVRSWPMRGTIHLMPAEDARWMINLLAPRQNARSVTVYRRAGLTPAILSHAGEVLAKELPGQRFTREELYGVLQGAGIDTSPSGGEQRGMHMIRHVAQEGLICITPRRGKQQTFSLFSEWVPPGRDLTGDAALAELAERYFRSHGPATVHDFAWWTGLTVTEARRGLEQVRDGFDSATVDGAVHWYRTPARRPRTGGPRAFLLPPYDEYTVAYADRGAVVDPAQLREAKYGIGPNVIVDGRIAGFWKRQVKKTKVVIDLELTQPVDDGQRAAIAGAADRYRTFLELPDLPD